MTGGVAIADASRPLHRNGADVDTGQSCRITVAMIYDRAWLEHAFRANSRTDFLFFWGHRPDRSGRMTPSCFSQWWPASFTVDGLTYPTAEHWMMAEKARLFRDPQTMSAILEATDPKTVKALGRGVKHFDAQRWDERKLGIVIHGNYEKFRQNADLRAFLSSTGDRVLVEASPVDPIWGIGLAADDEAARDPFRWRGANLLGFALMHVRDRLAG